MNFRKNSTICLLLALATTVAQAKKEPKYEAPQQLTPDQSALIEKAITREKTTIKAIQKHTPLVETYIQNMRPDEKLYAVPVSDQYMLSRVDFAKTFVDKSYETRESAHNKGFFKGSMAAITNLTKVFKLEYVSTGFMQMMFIDPTGFDQQHYVFSYVRRDFLGSVRTWVFDVHPKPGLGNGRFTGRIWVEDQDGNVVRFNGTYTGNTEDSTRYFHFDSWRMNLQPGEWLPVAVYAEETHIGNDQKKLGFRAQTRFWGYSLKLPTHESENVSIKVDDAVDKSDNSDDVSPLQASRAWVSQAQDNVLDRLVQAGLLANPSDFDKVLEQIATNLVVPNNLAFSDPIHCRVLLTTPLEALSVGNTILLSKGLIDTLPSEEAIATVVAFELAHIALGHHIDTRYAFNDRLLFPDEATFARISMYHSDQDNAEAAKKAIELLNASMYKDKLQNAGLYYVQLEQRGKELPSLTNSARIGDSLLKQDGTPWLAEVMKGAPKLDPDKLDQTAALPLGSNLKTDPWDDRVYLLNAKRYAPMNAREKMPLELTPVYLKLQRFDQAKQSSTAPPAAEPAAAPTAAQATPNGN